MSYTKRKFASRMLAMLLTVVLLGGILLVSAQAADRTNVKQYDYYVCMGDSIAAGYGPYAKQVRGFETVPVAYHGLVADATGADFQSLANVGMRTVEARWLLDDTYSASPEAEKLNAMYFNGMSSYLYWMAERTGPTDMGDCEKWGISDAIRDELKDYYGEFGLKYFYRDNIRKADLITVGLGLNDVFLYAMKRTAARLDDPNMNLVTEVATFLAYMNEGYQGFMENWAPMINAIKAINPDITIVVVGLYNPFGKVKLTDASWLTVGKAADVMVAGMNAYMQQQADVLGYKYADVTATEICDTVPFTDPTFFDEIVKDCHPTLAGHLYMMEQILAQLPERGSDEPVPTRFPFKDVTTANWFYNDVYYCWENGLMNGMSADTFAPQGTTTRAQFATVLYRMAGSPDVTGMTTPFTDVKAGSWYENAVIWGYSNGVINGTSATTFSPDASVTREQMVTMLFRYSGAAEPTGTLDQFTDANRISAYAVPAVIWAVQNNIVSGMGDGTFNPKGPATRAQLAKILHMYQLLQTA